MALSLAGLHDGCVHRAPPPKEIFAGLAQEGYTPNPGLSGLVQPGNIIQTMELGPNGTPTALAVPLVVAWSTECFPGQSPHEGPFVVAAESGSSVRQLEFEGPEALKLIPTLKVGVGAVSQHRMQLKNPRIRGFSKMDLSGRMSKPCVDALVQAIRDGDRPEWYSIVIESVVVESLRLVITWEAGVTADVKERITTAAAQSIGSIQTTGGDPGWGSTQPPAQGGGWGVAQQPPAQAGGWGAGQQTPPQGGAWGTAQPPPPAQTGGWGEAQQQPPAQTGGWGEAQQQPPAQTGGWGTAQPSPTQGGGWGTTQQPGAPSGGWGMSPQPAGGSAHGARVRVAAVDEKSTVIELAGNVVVAYRTRPVQPRLGAPAGAGGPPGNPSSPPVPSQGLREAFQGGGPQGVLPVARLTVRHVQKGASRRVRIDHPFRTGDAFQFEVTSSRPGFLFLMHAPPGGVPALLWPRPGQRPGEWLDRNEVRPQEPAVIPPSPAFLRMDDQTGPELFYVALRPVPEAPRLAASGVQRPQPSSSGGGWGEPAREAGYLAAATSPVAAQQAIVQFSVRGASGAPARGVLFDPGPQDPDPSVYFTAAPDDAAADVLLEFRLTHQR